MTEKMKTLEDLFETLAELRLREAQPAASPLNVDGTRPAVAWVASLPATWLTTTQRLILLVLACDAYELASAPGEDNLMQWCGIRGRTTLYDALKALEQPIPGLRPALLKRTTRLRRRTIYHLLADGSGSTDTGYPTERLDGLSIVIPARELLELLGES